MKELDKQQRKVLRSAINTYGVSTQQDVAIEEMSELIKAILKYRREVIARCLYEAPETEVREEIKAKLVENIVDEIADVRIMLEQLEMIFMISGEVERRVDFKIDRLSKRLTACSEE